MQITYVLKRIGLTSTVSDTRTPNFPFST